MGKVNDFDELKKGTSSGDEIVPDAEEAAAGETAAEETAAEETGAEENAAKVTVEESTEETAAEDTAVEETAEASEEEAAAESESEEPETEGSNGEASEEPEEKENTDDAGSSEENTDDAGSSEENSEEPKSEETSEEPVKKKKKKRRKKKNDIKLDENLSAAIVAAATSEVPPLEIEELNERNTDADDGNEEPENVKSSKGKKKKKITSTREIDFDAFNDGDYDDDDIYDVPTEKELTRKRRIVKNLILTIVILLVAGLIACGAYAYMAIYYQSHFYSGSVINGVDVSGMTSDQVKKSIKDNVATYKLIIKERDGAEEELDAHDIGLAYVDDKSIDKYISEQDSKYWIKNFFNSEKDYEVVANTSFDEDKALTAIKNLECLTGETIEPVDAKIETDANNAYYIVPEVEGNKIDEQKLTESIMEALRNCETEVDLEKDDCYVHPKVYSTDESLNKRVENWNKYLGINITYKFGDNVETIDSEEIMSHLVDDGHNVTLSTDWISKLVYAWGSKYDTFGLARTFTTHDGVIIDLPAGGDYGWCLNKDKMIADVTDCVTNGISGEREAIWLYKAMGWDNGDITGTYVEVSIPEQHLWLYENGVCTLDTDVVTGAPTESRRTKPGIYAIDAKKSPATLGRLDVQGYSSPVEYWAPFNGGQGLHDAPWRSTFGGSTYQSNGSHGCVNIPPDKAGKIYDAVSIGTAVIVYDDKTPSTTVTATASAAADSTADAAGTNAAA